VLVVDRDLTLLPEPAELVQCWLDDLHHDVGDLDVAERRLAHHLDGRVAVARQGREQVVAGRPLGQLHGLAHRHLACVDLRGQHVQPLERGQVHLAEEGGKSVMDRSADLVRPEGDSSPT
jgi:hypothetical protein